MTPRLFYTACFVVATVPIVLCKLVTIDNTVPRLTVTGDILDGHDGRISKFSPDGPYYLHTLSYGLCKEPDGQGCNMTPDRCGFHLDHNVSVFTSPDLSSGSWKYVANAIDVATRPAGTMFRPDIAFNAATKLYVLWWNWVTPSGEYKGYATSTSVSPEGPFTLVQEVVTLSHSNDTYHAGDWHFFIDDDGTGYVIYCAEFYCWIDELTSDYLGSTGKWVGPIGDIYFVEAPAMFKRNGTYYALFDHCCCFCFQGSGVRVYTAAHPLGPWTPQTGPPDLACVPPQQLEVGSAGDTAAIGVPATAVGGVITVVSASYGANCNASLAGHMTASVAGYCGGRADCGYQICICGANACEAGAPPCVPDPTLGCAKAFDVTWTCTGDAPGTNHTLTVPAEASDVVVPLSCSGAQRPWVAPTAGQGCLYQDNKISVTRSQQSFIAEVDTPSGPLLLWAGDRWQQAPDGIKGHEPQFWVPLQFAPNGDVLPINWVNNFTMDVI